MTPLQRAIIDKIRAEGRMSVEAFMDACNAYYYATRDPLGASGDFTTAPEISQMYGEMIGAALVDVWARAGRPDGVRYVELGPGRGSLAADALRVMRAAGLEPASVELVETSPILRDVQLARVPEAIFRDSIDELATGEGAVLLVASEFFDALPVRQFVDGLERHVIMAAGGLAFDRDGAITETGTAREEVMEAIARLLADKGGAAIIIDYGHGEATSAGDTLQAVSDHKYSFPLDRPGEQDLTAHVNFADLGGAARRGGGVPGRLSSQGSWLETLGIGARAMHLAAKNPEQAEAIASARRRLCDEQEMGRLFKVLAVRSPSWPDVAGLEP
nr:SAM-dependent methyltransferase [uncultured Sphingomonas sp.]